MSRSGRCRRRIARDDRGALLALTVVLLGGVGVMMLALADYTASGIKSSTSATAVMKADAAARGGLDYAVTRFAADVWAPCASLQALTVPTSLPISLDATALTLTCSPEGLLDGHPLVRIASQATAGRATVTFLADVQISADGPGAVIVAATRQ